MPSVVDLCNRALDKLGHKPITSLGDGNTAANMLTRTWPIVRDALLREHPWNFAVSRATTAPDAAAPAWGYTYQHTLPTDCLKLLDVDSLAYPDYQIEGGKILTNDDTLNIVYLRQVTDPNEYDPLFVELAASRLAYELAERLTQSNAKIEKAAAEYQEARRVAYLQDAQENPPVVDERDDWLTARL